MILYVDETENTELFLVAGILVDSPERVKDSFRHFRKAVDRMIRKQKEKEKVFVEFKSVYLDGRHQRLKKRMLEEIAALDGRIIYSCYLKKGRPFKQSEKEKVYLRLLKKIAETLPEDTDIVYDSFNKTDFDERIIKKISSLGNTSSVRPENSQKEPGLQYADNICSVLRLYLSGKDPEGYYGYIRKITHLC